MPKKTPIETREKLLSAATEFIVQNGTAGLTLDAVAEAAGVSKGGLLHHFPTKDALLRGLVRFHLESFEGRVAQELEREPERETGYHTRAYVRATFNPEAGEKEIGWALASIVTAYPELLSELSTDEIGVDDGLSPARATLIRLACDGYWMAEIGGLPPFDASQKQALIAELLELTR